MTYDVHNMAFLNFRMVTTAEMSHEICKKAPERCDGNIKLFAKSW